MAALRWRAENSSFGAREVRVERIHGRVRSSHSPGEIKISDNAIPESVVARIRKLLALARDTRGNENESSVAAEKAQSLLAEYNLEMSQIGGEAKTADATRHKTRTDLQASHDWQVTVMAALARNNFCLHWTESVLARRPDGTGKERWRPRHFLIGRQANIISTTETYAYLVETMERLCPYDGRRTERSPRSWLQGCADRLAGRLDSLRTEAGAASRSRTAGSADRGGWVGSRAGRRAFERGGTQQ